MQSFWHTLPRPFVAMAPMADVTDPAFRRLVARCGAPDVTWTEFVSADGLYHTREIQKLPDAENPLMRDLAFTDAERPIVAQFFSSKPDMLAYAARLAAELGFDGVDLNMGCPDRAIEKQGAGAALIKDPERATELVRAAQTAGLPVSVKTRIGYNAESLDQWLPALLAARPAAVTLHLRTRKEMSLVPAEWELMRRAVAIRDRLAPSAAGQAPDVLLIGNGDAKNLVDARAKAAASGADGVMIGRGMFGNPWVFAGRAPEDTPLPEKLAALVALARDFETLSPPKHFAILKKHVKAFVTGFDGAAELRAALMDADSAAGMEAVLERRGCATARKEALTRTS
ncbi:MAG TPA: tRNA-dihydrouridine synthase [Candidatus Paceibacterota bacterium]|nr:tRNA-dihydrouridine synthase [Candidatus Paceibacterota bacterium]